MVHAYVYTTKDQEKIERLAESLFPNYERIKYEVKEQNRDRTDLYIVN